ncbi:MAG TPA: hypothetical protein VL860_11475 [Planctomycetota bacterium]|jgi:hypothetical protein|nr:hypothetical protein [Planctomycetota bacterium]
MPLLRHSYRYQFGFLGFFLVAALTLSAVARAEDGGATKDKVDPDQTITDGCDKVLDIHGAIVRIRFVRQKLFIAVKSGNVEFKIPSGQKIFTIPAGRVVMVGPVDGTPIIGGITAQPNPNTVIFSNNNRTLLDANGNQLIANYIRLFQLLNIQGNNVGDHFNLLRASLYSNFLDQHGDLLGRTFRLGPYGTVTTSF